NRIQGCGWIKECYLAFAPGGFQLGIQFLPAWGTGRQQTENFGLCLCQAEKGSDKKSCLGFSDEIRIPAQKHVASDFLARVEPAGLVRGANGPGAKPSGRALVAGADSGTGQRVQLKRNKIILETDIMAIKMQLHL